MKVGDLVKCRDLSERRDTATGVIVKIKILPLRDTLYGVLWSFMSDQLGWQYRREIEVVNESR